MTEQQNGSEFDAVRILINLLGLAITAGVIGLIAATIIVET